MLETKAVTGTEVAARAGLLAAPRSYFDRLRDRIALREARVAVIGLGYVGLPLALAYADCGFSTIGLDVQEQKIALLRDGRSPLKDVPAGEVAAALRSGRFVPSDDFSTLAAAD